jgi:hypothetical protein
MNKYMRVFFLAVLGLSAFASSLTAVPPATEGFLGPKVFTFQIGESTLLYNYNNNRMMFDALDSLLAMPAIYANIDSCLITAAASPIGGESLNDTLSLHRADAMRQYLLSRYLYFPSERISTTAVGIDWEGFVALVKADENLTNKSTLLALVNSSISRSSVLSVLRMVPASSLNYLLNTIYPRLQYASVRLKMKDGSYIPEQNSSPLRILVENTSRGMVYDTVRVTVYDTVRVAPAVLSNAAGTPYQRRGMTLAIGSNLLYDALLLPNLTLELPVGRHWSIALEGAWSWWNTTDSRRYFHRIQMAGAEVRYRFRPWFIGVNAMGGTYDLRFRKTGYLSNWSYSAGVTGGYSYPLGKHWALEMAVGLGYLEGICHDYVYDAYFNDYPETTVRNFRYFGPTKVAVSMIYTI